MTETPAPDTAAVQIAADVLLGYDLHGYAPGHVVAALTDADRICPPGTLAEVARLRAELGTLRHYVGTTASRLGIPDVRSIYDGDAGLERVGEASLAEVERLRADVERVRALHRPQLHLRETYCATCCDPVHDLPLRWPCPTLTVLDAAAAGTGAEGTGDDQGRGRWWVSWYGAGAFTYDGPWWISGSDLEGRATIVAAVVADSADDARQTIVAAHDSALPLIEWRFVEARGQRWSPFSSRFPRAGWMSWSDAAAAGTGS